LSSPGERAAVGIMYALTAHWLWFKWFYWVYSQHIQNTPRPRGFSDFGERYLPAIHPEHALPQLWGAVDMFMMNAGETMRKIVECPCWEGQIRIKVPRLSSDSVRLGGIFGTLFSLPGPSLVTGTIKRGIVDRMNGALHDPSFEYPHFPGFSTGTKERNAHGPNVWEHEPCGEMGPCTIEEDAKRRLRREISNYRPASARRPGLQWIQEAWAPIWDGHEWNPITAREDGRGFDLNRQTTDRAMSVLTGRSVSARIGHGFWHRRQGFALPPNPKTPIHSATFEKNCVVIQHALTLTREQMMVASTLPQLQQEFARPGDLRLLPGVTARFQRGGIQYVVQYMFCFYQPATPSVPSSPTDPQPPEPPESPEDLTTPGGRFGRF